MSALHVRDITWQPAWERARADQLARLHTALVGERDPLVHALVAEIRTLRRWRGYAQPNGTECASRSRAGRPRFGSCARPARSRGGRIRSGGPRHDLTTRRMPAAADAGILGRPHGPAGGGLDSVYAAPAGRGTRGQCGYCGGSSLTSRHGGLRDGSRSAGAARAWQTRETLSSSVHAG